MWIADTKRMRELDRLAASEFGLTDDELMERVGEALLQTISEAMLPDHEIIVLCGKGKNGGDGLVAARKLKQNGFDVGVIIAARESECRCKTQLASLREAGIVPIFSNSNGFAKALESLTFADLIVDALLGVGAKGAARGAVAQAIAAINAADTRVLSVDMPSGIATDTGEELGEAVRAQLTVTIGLPKRFLFQGAGLTCAGEWHVETIDYPMALLATPTGCFLVGDEFIHSLLVSRPLDSHKGSNGHVLVVAGSGHMRGAAVLAAMGAVRSGAGLVTVAGVPEVVEAVSTALPEVLILPLASRDGFLLPEASDVLLQRQQTWSSAVFGPGLGQDANVRAFLHQTWADWKGPIVIDADALNAAAAGVPIPRTCPAVLTPHPGELARLLQTSVAEVQSDRFRSAKLARDQYEQTVVLKGSKTITAGLGMPLLVNDTGNPGMATGGMGDVLAGVIAGLISQGLSPDAAAPVGVHLHGMAGDLCEAEIGPIGYTASEVAQMLPRARAKLAECDS
jgi:NAD(P)H-hydrate epimerase